MDLCTRLDGVKLYLFNAPFFFNLLLLLLELSCARLDTAICVIHIIDKHLVSLVAFRGHSLEEDPYSVSSQLSAVLNQQGLMYTLLRVYLLAFHLCTEGLSQQTVLCFLVHYLVVVSANVI